MIFCDDRLDDLMGMDGICSKKGICDVNDLLDTDIMNSHRSAFGICGLGRPGHFDSLGKLDDLDLLKV